MKKIAVALTLLVAPALAVASPEVQVHQTPAPAPIVIHTRIVLNEFRVVRALPLRISVETMTRPRVLVTFHTGIHTAMALHPGEIVRLKIVPVRGRP